MCRVPVYGTKDAGRGFYLQMNAEIQARGFVASQICPATYYLFGKAQHLAAMMCTHVDDLIFAYTGEGKEAVDAILNRFSVGKIEEGSFRYCGRRFSQDKDCTIHVDVRDNTRNLKPAALGKDRNMNDPLAQEELTSLRSVVGGLAWISRYGRPDLAYRVNERQRCCHSKSTVQSLKDANRVTDCIDWNDLAVVIFSDASFANEAEFKSQQGRIHYITSRSDVKLGEHKFHLIGFGSSTLKRVCRATLQAEAYALQGSVESGDKLRALLCELTGHLKTVKEWYEQSQRAMLHLYFTDCRSLSDHLSCEVARKVQDKRLGIELSALRQALWINAEKTSEKYHPAGDEIEWIDTGRQLAGCLTKSMKPDFLIRVLAAGYINVKKPN